MNVIKQRKKKQYKYNIPLTTPLSSPVANICSPIIVIVYMGCLK